MGQPRRPAGRAVRIEPYTDAAFGDVMALWDACGINVPGNDPVQEIAAIRRSPHAQLFLGYLGPRLVGSVMAGQDGPRGWVYLLALAPDQPRLCFRRRLLRPSGAWLRRPSAWDSNPP